MYPDQNWRTLSCNIADPASADVALPSLAVPGIPLPFPHATLAQMQLAAAAAEVQARAQMHVQAQAQLMQYLPLHRQNGGPQEEAMSQPFWQPGVTLRLAAAGLTPPALPAPAVQPHAKQAAAGKPPAAKRMAPADEAWRGAANSAASGRQGPTMQERSAPTALFGGQQKKSKENLRTYLQEVRSEDPRCIFIARRINKLGFRSKALLEKHYEQFGEVSKILVAHSKVKPYPNSGTLPRTRPGNFGLVVMRSPSAVTQILEQGPEQVVGDVAIKVYRFEQKALEEEEEESQSVPEAKEITEADRKQRKQRHLQPEQGLKVMGMDSDRSGDWRGASPTAHSRTRRQATEGEEMATASNCSSGSGEAFSELQESNGPSGSSSNGSAEGSERTSASTMVSLTDLSHRLATLGSLTTSAGSNDKASNSSSNEHNDSNGNGSNGSDDHSSQGSQCEGNAQKAKAIPAADLVTLLAELGRVVGDFQELNGFTREQSVQVVTLAQTAQQCLLHLERECQLKIGAMRAAPGDIAPGAPVATSAASPEGPSPVHVQIGPQLEEFSRVFSSLPQKLPAGSHQLERRAHTGRSTSSNSSCSNNARLHDHGPGGVPRDTLRSHLTELMTEDQDCIFITRRINKLGFRSREILKNHFSHYGEVLRVLVAHSKVKPFRDSSGQMRTRPGGLGLIVMKSAAHVQSILALGEEQEVAGHQIRVQCFEPPNAGTTSGGSGTSTTVGSNSHGTRSNGSDASGSNGSSACAEVGSRMETSGSDEGSEEAREGAGSESRENKSEEGGSSEPYEKSEEGGSSGPESPESSH